MLIRLRKGNDRSKVSGAKQEKYNLFNLDCFLFGKASLVSFK